MTAITLGRNLRILITTVGLTALAACGGPPSGADAKSAETDEAPEPTVPVEIATAALGEISAAWRGSASLEAEAESDVVARVAGVVEAVFVEEGGVVSAGQALAKLDSDQRALEVRQAKAEMERLEADFKRNQAVFSDDLISREAFDRIKYEREAARAQYDMARLALEYSTIRAPIDGVISARYIKVGNNLAAGTPAFHVAAFDPLLAVFHVPEREIHKLAVGQTAMLDMDAWPDRRFSGTVERISPVVDPDTGTVRVTVAMDSADGALKPGMFGRVRIRYATRSDAVLVPSEAIMTEDARDAVFVINDGTAQRREVTTGFSADGQVEIVEGLLVGDVVVTTGQTSLRDGAPVEIIGAPDPGGDAADPASDDAQADAAAA